VENERRDKLPSLQEVLKLVNESVDDFASKPATSASDRGAFDDYPLHKIAIWGDVDAAEVLLAHGADINARGEDDDTPLHRAIAGRDAGMVKFLLLRGADPDLKNRLGRSPRDRINTLNIEELVNAMRAPK
jgi:ankyrin repeat protein